MKFIKQLFNFYINSSIHVALAVYSLTWITLLELGLEYNESVVYFVFYASITGYNFVKYFGIAKFHHKQLANWLRLIQILSFICFILMCFYAYQLHLKTLVFIVGFAALTFLYAIPFSSKQVYTLRSIGGLKIYIIALVWSGVTVLLPTVNEDIRINNDIILLGFQRFIYVLVLMLPFEIRDLKFDSLKLLTIPQRIGVKNTKRVGVLLLILFFFLEFFKDELDANQIIVLALITIMTLLVLLNSKIKQGHYYSSFWVEGLPILWLILLLVFN